MEGEADDATQKVINGRVVNKTPEELPIPVPVLVPKPLAAITNKQWQDVLRRIEVLEKKKK